MVNKIMDVNDINTRHMRVVYDNCGQKQILMEFAKFTQQNNIKKPKTNIRSLVTKLL